jgi:hypothetical protein
MMNYSDIRKATFIVTKQHFPNVIRPYPMPSGDERYSVRCPASAFPECEARSREQDELGLMVNVSSKHPPLVIPGNGTNPEHRDWQDLISQALRWNYSPNYLLIDREITVIGHIWHSTSDIYRMRRNSATVHASLLAVRVGGDFTKDEELAVHIIEVMDWFDK